MEVVEEAKKAYSKYHFSKGKEIYEYLGKTPEIFADAILMAASDGETSARVNLKQKIDIDLLRSQNEPLKVEYIGEITFESPVAEGKKIIIGYEYEISFEL
jgi:hypothetical protein